MARKLNADDHFNSARFLAMIDDIIFFRNITAAKREEEQKEWAIFDRRQKAALTPIQSATIPTEKINTEKTDKPISTKIRDTIGDAWKSFSDKISSAVAKMTTAAKKSIEKRLAEHPANAPTKAQAVAFVDQHMNLPATTILNAHAALYEHFPKGNKKTLKEEHELLATTHESFHPSIQTAHRHLSAAHENKQHHDPIEIMKLFTELALLNHFGSVVQQEGALHQHAAFNATTVLDALKSGDFIGLVASATAALHETLSHIHGAGYGQSYCHFMPPPSPQPTTVYVPPVYDDDQKPKP